MRARIFTIWLLLFIFGSLCAPLFELSPNLYLILGLILSIGSFAVFSKRYIFALIFALGLFFLSISGFQFREREMVKKNELMSAQKMQLVGFVSEVPTMSEFGQTVPFTLTQNEKSENIKIKLYARPFPVLEYGQKIAFETKIKPYTDKKWRLVKDGYAGEANLNEFEVLGLQSGVEMSIRGWLFGVRQHLNESISKSLPSAESGLASGLLLGEKAFITPEVTRQLQISGTTHIIALSGYNITIILGLFVFFEKKWNRLLKLLVPIGFIFAFVVMTGGAASLVRAAIMGFMPLLAGYLGRESDSFIAILFSAVIMIAFNPFLALFDVGFQLSFTALAGMVYLAPIIKRLLKKLPENLVNPFSETVGAQLAAMPLLAFYFGNISLISPFANLAILFLVPIGMLVAFLIGIFGLVWQVLGNLIAIPGYVLLHFINTLISFFGSIPAASKVVKIENPIWMLLAYFIIFDLWLILGRAKKEVIEI